MFISCNGQDKKSIVVNFIDAYNKKDSITTFKYLHKDFAEFYENETVIASKADYSNNYAWGKVMKDRVEFEIIKIEDAEVETMSIYYSDRDSLLGVSPYKSIRKYFIKNGQIIKIVESKLPKHEEYNNLRSEKYNKFFTWLKSKYKLTISDFSFDKKGAEKLKEKILEYSNTKL